jgi:hypothetical protein
VIGIQTGRKAGFFIDFNSFDIFTAGLRIHGYAIPDNFHFDVGGDCGRL